MNTALRKIGTAVLTGLAWAVVWAPIAVLIGVLIIDPDNSMDEMWVAIGAYPGFLCGLLFSALAARFGVDEASLSRAAAWGAGVGLLVGAVPVLALETDRSKQLLGIVVIGSIMVLSALSAVAWTALIRKLKRRASHNVRNVVA